MLATAERTAPPLATLEGTHLFDLKLDGVRAILYWDGAAVRLVNRNMVDITARYPDVAAQFAAHGGPPVILDGEIVARDDHSFESIALRDRQSKAASITRMAAQIPAQFIAFDVLSLRGDALLNVRYQLRRGQLEQYHHQWRGFDISVCTTSPALFDLCVEQGREGVIAKRATSVYQPGRRSADWVKFKCVRRVSCVPVGYEPGTGGRAHFGAMHLAMIGDAGPVIVGRVGTGFTAREIDELKGRLDRRELFVVEIECLNKTKGNQLRFPVYVGIRSDLSPADAATTQLDQLPTC